jgi:tetratricopeptide (TPR) repeat protein
MNVNAQTIQKFLGMSQLRPVNAAAAAPVAPTLTVTPRLSNAESRRRAERLIAEGDELFRGQNFHPALQKYKAAASAAPDMAEAFWREGHALVATKNFGLATTAFKRAVGLTEDLGRGGFQLDDLYGKATMSKSGHLESLAEYALSHSGSSDPYFLLGVFLTYDGQPARADKFFQRASDLAGIAGGHIAVFLSPVEETPRLSLPRLKPTVSSAASVPLMPIAAETEI